MKKFVFTLSIFVYGIVLGQVPQKLSYQAVIRDAANNIVSNQPVGIRISILQGSPTGTPVYIETHNPITNTDGLVSIEIAGGAVVIGVFSTIDWSKTPYFLFTEVDPTGGMSYSIFSTTELMSVPFAMFAERSRTPGPMGPQGAQGIAGINGVGINNAQIINDSLKMTLTNGNIINAGYVMGPKGDSGIQGQSGIDGISITNTQVINDSLKVTLSNGTIINAGYVKGDTGAQGIQGIQGLTGNDGISIINTQIINDSLKVTLSNGTIINTGYVKGAKGDTGIQGAQGIQGPAGNDGISIINSQVINDSLKVTLSNGTIINAGYVKGDTGAQGPQGLIGATGPQGVNGTTGAQGPAGNDGISVTNSQVINDSLKVTLSNGTIINAGFVKGDTGEQGPQGLTGATGPQGVNGATGAQGPSGNDGISITNSQVINDSLKVTLSNGTIINTGYVKGTKGDTGIQGVQGIQGPAGTNGISVTNSQVINDSLKVTLSSGNILNAGYVKGAKGDTGINITNVQIINDSLKVTLSSGNVLNAGKISNSISSGSSSIPISSIITYAGINPPSGWAFCNGDTLNRNTYSSLFSIIGTIYGSGDSAYWAQFSMPGRTFNLPDLRARVPIGVGQTSYNSINGGNSVTDLYNLGMRGGEEKHILSIAEMPAHSHSVTPLGPYTGPNIAGAGFAQWANGGQDSGITGGSQQHNIMQPFLVLNYIIKIQ